MDIRSRFELNTGSNFLIRSDSNMIVSDLNSSLSYTGQPTILVKPGTYHFGRPNRLNSTSNYNYIIINIEN